MSARVACPGAEDPRACDHQREKLLIGLSPSEVAIRRSRDQAPGIHRSLFEKIVACPERGDEIPVSAYPEGCCPGPTRFECRAGKGSIAGKPTTLDCVACRLTL